MGPWFAPLLAGLVAIAHKLVGRVLLSLGIGYVVFEGVSTSLKWAENQFIAGFAGAPVAVVQLAGLLQVGTCVSMLLSAVTARLVFQGMSAGGVLRSWSFSNTT